MLKLWQYFGLRWLVFRVIYALRMRTGLLARQTPQYSWQDRPLSYWLRDGVPTQPDSYTQWRKTHGAKFFFDEDFQYPANTGWQPEKSIIEADAILAGWWKYFSRTIHNVGFPPNWHKNVDTGQTLPADKHWSRIGDFAHGDIKLVWEASRFSVVYPLVRAYKLTGNEEYAEAFWSLVEDWAKHNPPNTGSNWKCGQEASLRVMAWCFGLYGFSGSPHSTSARISVITSMVAAQGERIIKNIDYAISTKGNHSISEGLGLWTIGLLFPEIKFADQWREKGRSVLEKELERQFASDGSYTMASFNYQRMSIHCYLLAFRLGELNNQRFTQRHYDRLFASLEFLYRLMAEDTGHLPNYGSNDGGLVLQTNSCDYPDYRPVIQLGYYLTRQIKPLPAGPWDEDLYILFGDEALQSPSTPIDKYPLNAKEGGYYTMHGKNSLLMARCANYQYRPTQSDQLHVDLWWHGLNIACDPGTYSYNAPAPWHNSLATAQAHNTVTVDGQDPMTKIGHFTWVDWPQGKILTQTTVPDARLECLEITHTGYSSLAVPVEHIRAIIRFSAANDYWLIVDRLTSPGPHDYRLHWLFADYPYNWNENAAQLELKTPLGSMYIHQGGSTQITCSLNKASEHDTLGWRSRYYNDKESALSFATNTTAANTYFWTLFSVEPGTKIIEQAHQLYLATPTIEASIFLEQPPTHHTIQRIKVGGVINRSLEVKP